MPKEKCVLLAVHVDSSGATCKVEKGLKNVTRQLLGKTVSVSDNQTTSYMTNN